MKRERIDCDTLVIGSGPGGATTACLLAEAGRDVLLIEEGSDYDLDSAVPYSITEMNQKYRNSGITPAFGRTKVTYIEGRCVGGGSEINAALCHYPMAQTLGWWRDSYQIDDFGPGVLDPYFRDIEKDLTVCRQVRGLDPVSLKIKEGAEKLGWASEEVPRFWKFPPDGEGKGHRQSMKVTMIPRAQRAGCRLLADTRAIRLAFNGRRAVHADVHIAPREGPPRKAEIFFKRVVICGGPIQTPCLLQRSGLRGRVGKNLRLHPMIRIVARFEEEINDPSWGVPVQQVVEFKPQLTLGCSQSALPHMVMWLGDDVPEREKRLQEWRKMAIFYVLVTGASQGFVRNIPGLNEPLVYYPIVEEDLALLGEGLYRLGKLLFSVGAVEIYNPIPGQPSLQRASDLNRIRFGLPHGRLMISTIHLFGTSAMGEDRRRCVTDSFGKMHDFENVWINDASLLPGPTGVNPQVTIMAVARRNVRRMLDEP